MFPEFAVAVEQTSQCRRSDEFKSIFVTKKFVVSVTEK